MDGIVEYSLKEGKRLHNNETRVDMARKRVEIKQRTRRRGLISRTRNLATNLGKGLGKGQYCLVIESTGVGKLEGHFKSQGT